MIRVVVAEDHLAVADGILAYFKYHDSISIIGHAKNGEDLVKLVGKGKTNQEIADALFIGKTTVETHRKNMIRKLGLHGPGELLRYALQRKYDF